MDAAPAGERRTAPPLRAPARRCPACGEGDLVHLRIARRDGEWRGVYCAGLYDHDRRRFLRRGCGYAGANPSREQEAATGTAPVAALVAPAAL